MNIMDIITQILASMLLVCVLIAGGATIVSAYRDEVLTKPIKIWIITALCLTMAIGIITLICLWTGGRMA